MISRVAQAIIVANAVITDVSAADVIPNMQPGLLPPEGTMWRGATIDTPDGADWSGTDPNIFEQKYGIPLQIFRNFHNSSNA